MVDDFVTQAQFKDFTTSIRDDIRNLNTSVNNLADAVRTFDGSVKLMETQNQLINDKTYRKKEDMIIEAREVLDDATVIEKHQLLIKRTITEYACEIRDSGLKTWQSVLIASMIFGFIFNAYNNTIIIKNQKTMEKNQTTNTQSILRDNQRGDKQ